MLIRREKPSGTEIVYIQDRVEVRLVESGLAPLVAHLETLLDEPPGSDTSLQERADACLRRLAEQDKRGVSWFTSWCVQAAVGYDRYLYEPQESPDGDGPLDTEGRRVQRWVPLERRVDDEVRVLGVMFYPTAVDGPHQRPFGVTVREEYWSADFTEPYWYDVKVAYADLSAVLRAVAGVETPADDERAREDQWAAHLERQVAAGMLGGAAPRGSSRDRVAGWYAEHGLRHALDGVPRRVVLLKDRTPATDSVVVLLLLIGTDRYPPEVRFIETSQRTGHVDWTRGYDVAIPFDKIDALVRYLTGTFALAPPPPTPAEERLIDCLRQLVDRGELRAGLPHRTMRQRVADWLEAAGVPAHVGQSQRIEILLDVYRRQTDCLFQLRLVLDPVGTSAITFWEEYEYFARSGDGGGEYGYGVKTPYASLGALVAALEERSGRTPQDIEDLEDRLVGSLRRLVEQGELGADLPIKENCARVTAWFVAAGVPTEPVDWVWVNAE